VGELIVLVVMAEIKNPQPFVPNPPTNWVLAQDSGQLVEYHIVSHLTVYIVHRH